MFKKNFNFEQIVLEGFSLIELLIVVAIIGVLAGLGSVSYSNYQTETARKAGIRNIQLISRALETDLVVAINDPTLGTSEILKGIGANPTCQEAAIQAVRNLRRTQVNAFDKTKDPNKIAAYGNFMVSANDPTIHKGSIVVACVYPEARLGSESYRMYQCHCDNDDCLFNEFGAGVDLSTNSGCPYPTDPNPVVAGANPYNP